MERINFNNAGACLSFEMKLRKHINAGNCYRVKDYLCAAYNTWCPKGDNFAGHPCCASISEGTEFLKSHGWHVGLSEWKNIGEQLICVSPNDEYYHSSYNYGK